MIDGELTPQQLTALAFDMRAAATLIEKISGSYDARYYGHPAYRQWSPHELRSEAEHLERKPLTENWLTRQCDSGNLGGQVTA